MFDHYPKWAANMAQTYLSKSVNHFVIHGNIHDLVPVTENDASSYLRLKTFLSEDFFGGRDYVLFYDRASGIYFRDAESRKDFNLAMSGRDSLIGTEYAAKLPKDPVRCFTLLEAYYRSRIQDGKSIAVIIEHAETIIPASDSASTGSEDRNSLVQLLKWAHNPLLLAADFTVCLLTENMNDLNRAFIQNPYTGEVHIDFPSEDERRNFLINSYKADEYQSFTTMNPEIFAQMSSGLKYLQLQRIVTNAIEQKSIIDFNYLTNVKKEQIESEAYGLLEFVETRFDLDTVAGHKKVKNHLRQAVTALKSGRRDVMPMGYLVCGPVGTGKTFLVTCFANEIGIPMVKLKNFRSQWQGVTEGNLEKILALLKAMAPVAVMIDEADAYLGDRNAGGDSGVSSRVFSQIATFMSNTENRGKIVWFLMTARPDLMPIDLKRQGRAEEHLALFAPSTKVEREELFVAMKRKVGLALSDEEYVPHILDTDKVKYSGADMEAALTRAKFRAVAIGSAQVTPEILDEAFADFIPPNYPEEVEYQTLQAVLECTSRALLPEEYANIDPAELSQRIAELKYNLRV